MHHPNSFEAWLKDKQQRRPEEWIGARCAEPLGVRLKTGFLDRVSELTDRKTRLQAIRGMQYSGSSKPLAPGHSHPVAARIRADSSRFLDAVASKLNKRRYDVSLSAREARNNTAGSRQFRFAKDLLSDSVHGKLHDSDFVTCVDTDYYMSERELSAYAGHDIGIYALRPDGLSGGTQDSAWRFVSQDRVVEEVAGGAVYSHQVWDWGKDLVTLRKGFRTYLYDPVVFPVSNGRVVVVLLLARVIRIPFCFASRLLPDLWGTLPSRMEVVKQGDFLLGVFGPVSSRKLHILHTGTVGEGHAAISLDTFRALSIASKIPNTDRKITAHELAPSGVERICKLSGESVSAAGMYLLSRYFSTAYKPHQFLNYQSKEGLELEDGECKAKLAAVPLAGAGCAPTASHNNEARAIKSRVVDVANTVQFTTELIGYAEEFSKLVVPRLGEGIPWSANELRSAQHRPTQRARRLQEEQFLADNSNNLRTCSFQKAETYPKVGDPRLINQVPTDHTNRLCSYSGAIKPFLKERHGRWYAVGKTPLGIASSLQKLWQSSSGQLVGGDYSRMDGRTSASYRRFVLEPIYMRYFSREYHSELQQLLRKEEAATTKTRKFGVKATMSGANLSGSGVTTDLNTFDAAFNEFAARRRNGQDPQTAFRKLGIYFGDDSVVDAEIFDKMEEVARDCGMKLEKEPVPEDAGPGFVAFLSRCYPDIRTSLASHPVMVRSLRKMCTVMVGPSGSPKDQAIKLRLKAEAVLITDPHVPVLAAYARALKRVYHLDALRATEKEWKAATDVDSSYAHKREAGAFPCRPDDVSLLWPSVAAGLGISEEEARLLESRLEAATTEADLARVSLVVDCAGLPDWAFWVPV